MTQDESGQKPQPKTVEEYLNQGWLYHAAEKNEQAAEVSFRKAIDINPRSADAYYGLGLVLIAQAKLEAALDSLKQVLELLDTGHGGDDSQAVMLRHLTTILINRLESGII